MDTMNLSKQEMELKEKYGDEKVLVVKSEIVPSELNNEAFANFNEETFNSLIDNSEFIYRYQAEKNPAYRQIIPYLICGVNGKFLAVKRLAKSGEERLVNNIALGVGGHINPGDSDSENGVFMGALLRELGEELEIPVGSLVQIYRIGFINDTSNEVGKDHLGVACVVSILTEADCDVTVKETDKLEGIRLDRSELDDYYEQFENWSKIVYDNAIGNK